MKRFSKGKESDFTQPGKLIQWKRLSEEQERLVQHQHQALKTQLLYYW